MSLYLKYRPKTLDEIIGNKSIVTGLDNMLQDLNKCPHSFLLHGPTGCGKTTVGRIIANRLGTDEMEIIEVDSGQFRGIDTVRDIRQKAQYSPMKGSCRVWVLDEIHQATRDAQNALLKILEDTPAHVYFILCTTEPQKLLPTIKGRCQQFELSLLNNKQMYRLLHKAVKGESSTLKKEVYDTIIKDSNGYPRNALQTLEQVLSVSEEEQLDIARRNKRVESESIELCRALLKSNSWPPVMKILNGLKDQEPESIRRHVLGYCQAVLLKEDNEKAGIVMEEFIEPFYNSLFPGLVFACYSVIKS